MITRERFRKLAQHPTPCTALTWCHHTYYINIIHDITWEKQSPSAELITLRGYRITRSEVEDTLENIYLSKPDIVRHDLIWFIDHLPEREQKEFMIDVIHVNTYFFIIEHRTEYRHRTYRLINPNVVTYVLQSKFRNDLAEAIFVKYFINSDYLNKKEDARVYTNLLLRYKKFAAIFAHIDCIHEIIFAHKLDSPELICQLMTNYSNKLPQKCLRNTRAMIVHTTRELAKYIPSNVITHIYNTHLFRFEYDDTTMLS
jgi:hypothetical protein